MTLQELTKQILAVISFDNDYDPEDITDLVIKYLEIQNEISLNRVVRSAAQAWGIEDHNLLYEKNQKRVLVRARYFVFYHYDQNSNRTLESIGNIFGKDHATVLHARTVIENELELVKETREAFTKFRELLTKKPSKAELIIEHDENE